MGFPMLKKLAIAIALIDLLLAVHDGRNAGRFFLLLTVSSTFDIVPDNIIHKHCEDEFLMNPSTNNNPMLDRMCKSYADILLLKTRRPITLFSVKNNYVNNPNVSIYFDENRKHSCWRAGEGTEEDVKNEGKGNNIGGDESQTERSSLSPQGHIENQQKSINQLNSGTKTITKTDIDKPDVLLRRSKRKVQENQHQQILINSKTTVELANATVTKESFSTSKLTKRNESETKKPTNVKVISTELKVKHNVLSTGKQGDKNSHHQWRIKAGKDIPFSHHKDVGFTLIKRYPKLVTRFIEEGILLQWPCVVSSAQIAFNENNISSTSSPEAQKIKFRVDVDPFRLDVIKDSEERLMAVQQLLYDHPWLVIYNLYSKLPGAFTRAFVVITVYTWLWGTVIALMLLIGALTDDQTTLHGWIIFNILYSLLQFMMDQWIHNNITPYKSRLVIWLFLLYSVYKPTSALIGFSRWSDCAVKKATWIFPDGVLSVKTDRRNTITVGIHELITDGGDITVESEGDSETKQSDELERSQMEKI